VRILIYAQRTPHHHHIGYHRFSGNCYVPCYLEARGLELLTLSREGRLSNETEAELEEFTRLGHLMNRVKLKARLKLAGHE